MQGLTGSQVQDVREAGDTCFPLGIVKTAKRSWRSFFIVKK